jgi:hypothetical protein
MRLSGLVSQRMLSVPQYPSCDAGLQQFPQVMELLEELAGHDDALDLVGALVDLGGRGPDGSFRR